MNAKLFFRAGVITIGFSMVTVGVSAVLISQSPQSPSPPIADATGAPTDVNPDSNADVTQAKEDPETQFRKLDPTVQNIAAAVGQARMSDMMGQRETVEFLWTPGELLRQIMDRESMAAYPNE